MRHRIEPAGERMIEEPRSEGARADRRRVSRRLLAVALLLLLGLAWTDVVASSRPVDGTARPFPAFALPTLDGGRMDEAGLRGQVTVVNVWASWCPPCRSEAPVLREVARDTAAGGTRFLGVLYQDEVAPAREFAVRLGLDFPTVVDDGALSAALGVRAIPMTFVVDAEGRIRARHFGPIREGDLRVLIEDARQPLPGPEGR